MPPSSPSSLLSIQQLLDHTREDGDWGLAVAQRSFEWDENRISNLVDSLLEGFPIGTLLIVEGARKSYAMGSEEGPRKTTKKPTQVLDGQQRCLSIRAVFTDEGLTVAEGAPRQLWIHVGAPNAHRQPFHPKEDRRTLLHWSARSLNGLGRTDRKIEHLPTQAPATGWIRFCDLVHLRAAGPKRVAAAARADRSESCTRHISQLTARLRTLMDTPTVPVHRWTPRSGDGQLESLHQAFVRLNTGGVSLKGEDQFFAGVKLYWPEAEERLAPLQEASGGLLTHRSALELVARVARLSLDGRDLAPLRLRDLARWGTSERKNDLVQQMRLLSRPRGALSSRLRSATQTLCSCLRERIGGGSAHIGRPQLLASIAWLYRFTGARRAGSEEGIEQLVWMMFWSTAFSSHSYGKARFSRRLMTTAWRHGEQGRPIGRSARLLGLDHRFVRPLFWGEEQGFTHQDAGRLPGNKTLLIGRHRDLFLRLFQGIGPATELEWDHIFPYSRARRLFRREGSRGQIKEFARWVNHPGNLAGIAPRANRVLGDRDLPEKLGWDGAASAESYAVRAFIQTDPNIDADEEQILRDFHSHRAHRDRAGPLFREFVLHRTRRVWDYAVERVGSPPACPEDPADAKRSQK